MAKQTLLVSRCMLLILCGCLVTMANTAQGRPADLSHWGLWYNTAAGNEWTAALPIGNGRLGGMVFGNVVTDRIQLNEDTLWTGRLHRQTGEPARLTDCAATSTSTSPNVYTSRSGCAVVV